VQVDPFGSQLDFDRLGPVTGGRVIRSMNDIDKQIANSADLGRNLYMLGYSPSNSNNAPRQYRNMRVACLPTRLTVTTRNGYYTTPVTAGSFCRPPHRNRRLQRIHLYNQHTHDRINVGTSIQEDRRHTQRHASPSFELDYLEQALWLLFPRILLISVQT
jgi:hypothetical protein